MATRTLAVQVLQARPEHADDMERIEQVVYDEGQDHSAPDSLCASHFRQWIATFPEGQFVAVDVAGAQVVGLTTSMRVDFDPARPFTQPWLETTAGATLSAHRPDGAWMYGVESAVLPAYQGQGVGKQLYDARFALARRLNLRGIVAGSTIMNYHLYADLMPPEVYVREVEAGRLFDNNLTKQLKLGFRILNVIPNYVSDRLSRGWGCAIVWDNPDYMAS